MMVPCLRYFVFLISALLFFSLPGTSEGWEGTISLGPNLPMHFFAIDKSKQQLIVFLKQSPPKIAGRFSCTTGQVEGDKREEGDLRTPEGVYFLEAKVNRKLDFALYGGIAYTLNFPNPVDRIQGKGGSGIWLHGRGNPIVPRETKGCVAVNTNILSDLEQRIIVPRQTPVLIAKSVKVLERDETHESMAAGVIQATRKWAKAWREKSDSFFTFYHQPGFALAQGRPFSSFRVHKESIFRQTPWIEVFIDSIQVLPGPDYWVTYFGQFYRTPTFQSEGIKRLYWQHIKGEGIKIVGAEWVGADLGLKSAYTEQIRSEIVLWLENWRKAWLAAEAEEYIAYYTPNARQGNLVGSESILTYKNDIWESALPERISLDNIEVELHPRGAKVTFVQDYAGSNDYSDKGIKTLILKPHQSGWLIVDEQWREI